MTELEKFLVVIGVSSLLLSLVSIGLVITVAFRRIQQVESHIATEGKYIDNMLPIWGEGPLGRWMRAAHVFFFFAARLVPRYGPVMSARLGDEATPVPRRLKLWATVPMAMAFILMAAAIICSWYLGAFEG